MKHPLKFLPFFLTLALAAVPAVRAEDAPSDKPEHKREHNPGAMMEHMARELRLTADQEAKWKAIGEQERTALKALHKDTTIAKKDKWAKMKEIKQSFADQRRAVLTADQAKKFDEMREKRHEHREHGEKKDHQ